MYILCSNFQSVNLCRLPGGDSAGGGIAAFGHHTGGGSGVAVLPGLQASGGDEIRALGQALVVGIDGLQAAGIRAGQGKQAMMNRQLRRPHDGEAMLHEQIIVFMHGSGGGILHRQNAR